MRRAILSGKSLIQGSSLLRGQAAGCSATSARLYSGETITCTLFPGDGIGPEIAEAVKHIFEAAHAPIDWDEQYIGKVADPRTNSMVTRENLDSVLVGTLRHLCQHSTCLTALQHALLSRMALCSWAPPSRSRPCIDCRPAALEGY